MAFTNHSMDLAIGRKSNPHKSAKFAIVAMGKER